ncbi:hypothetical protein HMSSN036_80250 [Paenibacillus macerans]|nr:hypothetical protein HMSSN036_80250 [Paenibacillus macerans]
MMGIHPINKLNFRDILKSPSYLVMLNIMLIVPLNSMLQILKTNTGLMEFIVVYVFLMLNVSIYFFLNMLTISLIVISEKSSGRCEYYLANQVDVRRLTGIYSRSSYSLNIGPILLLDILMAGYAIARHETVLLHLFQDVSFVWFAATYLLFTYLATSTLTLISMLSKSPERIRTYLSVSSFLFIFAATLPAALIKKLGFIPNGDTIVWFTGSTLLVLAMICASVRMYLSNKLNNEIVILSYKQ